LFIKKILAKELFVFKFEIKNKLWHQGYNYGTFAMIIRMIKLEEFTCKKNDFLVYSI